MNDINFYPKILVLGMNFSSHSGGGVTLTNLFYNWPKEKLFIANEKITDIDINYVNDFYILNGNDSNREKKKLIPRLLNVITSVQCKLNLLNGKIEYYSNTDQFLKWVKSLNPDIIYFMTHKIQHIKLIQVINTKTDYPVAVHIVDDWLQTRHSTIYNELILYKLDIEFKKILLENNVFFSISDDMRFEYKSRYNTDFLPIHNPILKKNTLSSKQIDKKSVKILYAGSIEKYNIEELIDLCKSIVNSTSIIFNIYGNFRDKKHINRFKKYSNCFLKGSVDHNTILKLMSTHDILFLPMSFNKQMKQITKLSMPTKFTEYINSGTVTLLYAPEKQAVTNYSIAKNCAYIVSEKSHAKLKETIKKLIDDTQCRELIVKNARELALSNHHIEKVQKHFINSLIKGINNEKY